MKEIYREIFSDVDIRPMLGAARYMLQLELMKEDAIKIQEEIRNTEYPFVETGKPFPKIASAYADDLVAALSCEGLEADRVFRCYLRKLIEETEKKQERELDVTFSSRTLLLCKIIRSLKEVVDYKEWETEDNEILDIILRELCLDCYLIECLYDDELDDLDEPLEEYDEDLDIEEPGEEKATEKIEQK